MRGRWRVLLWLTGTAALSLPFLIFAAAGLENFRPFSDDEALIVSASFKLADEGVFGSDLYTGLFNGEQRYYFNLPVQHLLQAGLFSIAGPGIAQARWVSLAAAALIIWLASWLAFRWYGVLAAWLTTLLLIVWRSDLAALYPGLPLLSVARSARYDVVAVAGAWLSIVLLDRLIRRPDRLTATLVGFSAGLAALTQFFGVFVAPVIAVICVRQRRFRAKDGSIWIGVGFVVVIAPYVLFAAAHGADWIGQNVTIREAERVRLDAPSFYLENLLHEPRRFAHLTQGTLSSWLLVFGVWPALAWGAVRARERAAVGDRILIASVVMFAGGLALVDATKAPLYAIALLPPLCIVSGAFVAQVIRWSLSAAPRPLRVAALICASVAIVVVVIDGQRAFRIDSREAQEASSYLEVGARIRPSLPERTAILGPHRWWWALHDHRYLSLHNVWWQWRLAAGSGAPAPEFADWVVRTGTQYIIVTNDVRAAIRRVPERLQQQFWRFLETDCSRVAVWRDHSYSEIALYRVEPP